MSVPTRFRGRRVTLFRAVITLTLAAGGPLLTLDLAPTVALAATQSVSIQGTSPATFAYNPSTSNVNAGDTVQWTNNSTAGHTVTRCDTTNCPAVGPGSGTNPLTFSSGTLTGGGVGTFSQLFDGGGTYNYYCAIHGYAVMHGTVSVMSATPSTQSAISTSQYTLANSDGTNWQEIDSSILRISAFPSTNQSTLLTANADLFTGNAGFNQDLGIFVSDGGGTDSLVAWKESGGFAGVYSPNAAFVQSLFSMTSGHNYVFKLKWKTNKSGTSTIYAGAGSPGTFSHTSLTAETFPGGVTPNYAVSTSQYTLSNSDGVTWQTIDGTNLATAVTPASNSTAVVGANVDLFTANAGFNQDIAIFVSDNGGTDSLVAWKESGGFAGIYSPNAAFVKATFAMTATHQYNFKLKWKTNQPGTSTIYAAAGSPGNFSPTSLFAEIPSGFFGPDSYAASSSQYTLSNSDGTNWQLLDAALNVSKMGSNNVSVRLGGNVDLFTGNAGFNQDIGLFVSDGGGADTLLAWKESGGFAGIYSPNAAFVQVTFPMASGHSYVFKLKWKTNKSGTSTIYAAAGSPGNFSPTRLTAEVTS